MKPIISNDLRKRIITASENGSIIAKELLNAIKASRNMEEETDKTINYFDSKRMVKPYGERKIVRIVVTCCMKDLKNEKFPDRGNASAPYFPENRTDISVKDFAKLFRAIREKNYSDKEWQYFDSAVRVNSKIKLRIGNSINDFIKAYMESNYIMISQDEQSTLHSSCMRYEHTARNAADFYKNFAGAKILIAETSDGEVCGRALLWQGVQSSLGETSFIDRIYSAFDPFMIPMMKNYAAEQGYILCKTYNDYSHKKSFTLLREWAGLPKGESCCVPIEKTVPSIREHKKGAPYVDTMSYVKFENGDLKLCNDDNSELIMVSLSGTSGYGNTCRYMCPVCGKLISRNDFCQECRDSYVTSTLFGEVMKAKVIKYKHLNVPDFLMENGKPKKIFEKYMTVTKLTSEI